MHASWSRILYIKLCRKILSSLTGYRVKMSFFVTLGNYLNVKKQVASKHCCQQFDKKKSLYYETVHILMYIKILVSSIFITC